MESIELDGTTIRFGPLTLVDEDKWRDWLRTKIKMDAKKDAEDWGLTGEEKVKYLAEISARTAGGACDLLTPFGMEHASTISGAIEILKLAAAHHHPEPGPDDATLRRIVLEKQDELKNVIPKLLPIHEKKVSAGPKGGPS